MVTDNKEQVKRWNTRRKDAESLRNLSTGDWKKNYKAVYGDDYLEDGKRSGDDSGTNKQKKYIYDILSAYLKTEIPSLILYRPEIFITATENYIKDHPEGEQEAKAYQDVVNEILNDMDGFEFEVKSCLADAHCAFGVCKVTAEPIMKPHPQAGQLLGVDPLTNEPIAAPETVLANVKFDINRVDPQKFLIDKRCKNDPNKGRWMGEEIDRTLEELSDGDLYNQEVLKEIEDKTENKDKDPWEIDVKIYEKYDRFENRIIVTAEGYDTDFLRYEDTPITIDQDPYAILKFFEIPGQFYPKPEITSGRQLQEDMTDIRQWMKKQALKSIPKKGIRGALAENEEEQKKLVDGISDIVKCGPNDLFDINTDLKLGSAVGDFAVTTKGDFDEVMGQPSQDRGITGDAKFATEAQIAEQQGNVREQDKLNTVKVWLSTILEKLIYAIKNSGYAELKNLNLDIDLNIEIDIESKTAKSKAIDRKQLTEVLTIISQNPIFMQSPTLLDQILRDYDIREKDKIIQELQAAVQAQAEASKPVPTETKPPINISLALSQEYMNENTLNFLLDYTLKTNVPVTKRETALIGGIDGRPLQGSPAESVGAGTEGIEPDMNYEGSEV
jgi:hypothetical protein